MIIYLFFGYRPVFLFNLKKNRSYTLLTVLTQLFILNQHLIRASLKGVAQITAVPVLYGRIGFLNFYVFPNLGFIQVKYPRAQKLWPQNFLTLIESPKRKTKVDRHGTNQDTHR